MIKNFSLIVFCCFALSSFGQSSDYIFGAGIPPDKLKTDFSILVSSLVENHPDLYGFTTKSQFDSLAEEKMSSLTGSLTEAEFHVVIRKFIRSIGCGHTVARPSDDWYGVVRAKEQLIPIHVFLQDDQLYVKKIIGQGSRVKIGSRLISIDSVSVSDILAEFRSIVGRDGISESMINRNVERLFQTLYAFSFGTKEVYHVEVESEYGKFHSASLKGGKARKYFSEIKSEVNSFVGNGDTEFGTLRETEGAVILDLNSFQSKGFKKFYRKMFKELTYYDDRALIIDLRGNGGGYFPNGNRLLRYLLNEEFTMDYSKPRNHTKNNKYLKLSFLSHVSRFIFSTIPDRNKEDTLRNYQVRFKPIKKNHFDGPIYVLTDGLTFSTGSFVASKLKNSRGAVIIGEETGGGEVGFNAVLSWKLNLPSSGVIVTIPMYHVDVQPEMENIGRGVMPDIPINYSLDKKMYGFDLEIERIIELLRLN